LTIRDLRNEQAVQGITWADPQGAFLLLLILAETREGIVLGTLLVAGLRLVATEGVSWN